LTLPAHSPIGTVRLIFLATHAGTIIAITMNRQHIQYKGYEVAPVAQPLPNGLFAANLTIEKASATQPHAYSFDALDYFFDEEHALAYAFRWGRLWIDSQARFMLAAAARWNREQP
jgi:hypothetical protein